MRGSFPSDDQVPRRAIRLDENDVVAAAQILAWIALPHRPHAGVDLLCNWFWARRHYRGQPIPELPFKLKKPSLLGPQLEQFRRRALAGFRAGLWFEQVVMSTSDVSWFEGYHVSVRSLARRLLTPQQRREAPEETGNKFRDIWSPRKPFAHLAAAAACEIANEHERLGVAGFDLEMTLFNPVWVPAAIEQAEGRARGAASVGAFALNDLVRFRRDNF